MGSGEHQTAAFDDSYRLHLATFPSLEGAESLIKLYGGVPSFHDAEITDLHLRHRGSSSVRIGNLYPTIFDPGRVFVTFEIAELVDVVVDGFNHRQNVMDAMHVRPARHNPERYSYHGTSLQPGDSEIEIFPIVGLGAQLVCRGVKLSWTMNRRAREARKRPDLLGQ